MHVCKYGDPFCGGFGFSSLCKYCKKNAELELAAKENELRGMAVRREREERELAYDALGSFVVENPKASLGIAAGLFGLSLAVQSFKDSKRKSKEMPSFAKRKK